MNSESDFKFRWGNASDFISLGQVMFDAVRQGQSLYSEPQRQAWVPEPRKGKAWVERLSSQEIIIAKVHQTDAGFMSLMPNGYIDFAYVRPQYQGRGLFRRLYTQIEIKASQGSLKRLTTHASLMAQPAFAAVGFKLLNPETVEINGVSFDRFEMAKTI